MRVVEESASSTTCAIMNEEKNINGKETDGCNSRINQSNEENHSPNSDYSEQSHSSTGGRLKFFKDGKFILELSHRRDGEKMSWISVPKKTHWPPPSTPLVVANNLRQEGPASLSVSDDNSSVQLSPWQRDHCWKQTSPKKAASPDMSFFMVPFPRAFHVRKIDSLTIKRKRRRPFEPIEKINWKGFNNVNGCQRAIKSKSCAMKNGGLHAIIQRLWDFCTKPSESVQSVQKLSPSMFSPRKRILREFERVSLVGGDPDDQSQLNLKRQKAKATCATVNGQGPPHSAHQATTKGISSYSITSLLAAKDEPHDQESSFLRTLLKSPKREESPELVPKSRRSPSSPPPPPGNPSLRGIPYPSVQVSYLHSPLLYSHFVPQSPAAHHSYFGIPSSFRGASPALWGVPYHNQPQGSSPLQGGPYQGVVSPYSSSPYNFWPPLDQTPVTEFKKEDATPDVPLNLSKNAG